MDSRQNIRTGNLFFIGNSFMTEFENSSIVFKPKVCRLLQFWPLETLSHRFIAFAGQKSTIFPL